jgi:hypothetical protein
MSYKIMLPCLGAFAKLRKRLLASSWLSVRMEHDGSHWTTFHEIRYLITFRKSVEKIQVWLKSDKNNGPRYMKTYVHLWYYLAGSLLEWEVFQTKVVEKIKHFMFNNLFLGNGAVYEIMQKKYYRAGQATNDGVIWHMRIAFRISKSVDTHRECVMFISFPLQHRSRERAALCSVIRILPGMLWFCSVLAYWYYLYSSSSTFVLWPVKNRSAIEICKSWIFWKNVCVRLEYSFPNCYVLFFLHHALRCTWHNSRVTVLQRSETQYT